MENNEDNNEDKIYFKDLDLKLKIGKIGGWIMIVALFISIIRGIF